jgi:hypothetical protein
MRFDQGVKGKTGSEATLDAGAKEVTWHDDMTFGRWACHSLREITNVSLQLMGQGGDHMGTGWTGANYTNNTDCYLADANKGDWTKYTVYVKQPGIYSFSILAAADPDTQWGHELIALSFLNGKDSVSTGTDTMHWTGGGGHVWWYLENFRRVVLDSGLQVLRYDVPTNPPGNGPMNMDYLDITYIGPVGTADRAYFSSLNGGLSLRSITPQASKTLQLNFTAAEASPATVQCFDSRGSLLFTETMNNVALGYNHIQLKNRVPGSGMVFVRMTQGNKTAQGKVFLFAK